jgi:hypothetical protein
MQMANDDEKYEIEKDYRVVDNQHGVSITVGPDRDGVGCVEIYTKDKSSEEFFGKMNLVLSPKLAKKLASALLAAAADQGA